MKKILLLSLLIASPLLGQEVEKKDTSTKTVSKDPNKKFKSDTVGLGLSTSILGGGYFEGDGGLLSSVSLEIFGILKPNSNNYLYVVWNVLMPVIEPTPKNIFSGVSVIVGIGYGNWVYKKIDSNQKGWLVGINTAFLSGIYNQYVADKDSYASGWIFSIGATVNMRAIYQLHRNFGFLIGADLSYYYTFVGLDLTHGLTGGITLGIAF